MRSAHRWILILCGILSSASLMADSPAVSLYFKSSGTTLTYLATYHAQTTDVLNISKPQTDDQILKNNYNEYVEVQKDVTRFSSGKGPEAGADASLQSNTLETSAKIYFIKKVEKNRVAKSIQPEVKTQIHSAIGRLIEPFNMEELPYFGLPVFFPREPVKEGDTWEKKFDFTGVELPILVMGQQVTLKRMVKLHLRPVAELEYTFKGGLNTTQMTNDLNLVDKIRVLKDNHIESVSFEGTGRVAFDVVRGTIVTQDVSVTKKVRKVTIRGEERIVQDLLTTAEFTEALTN